MNPGEHERMAEVEDQHFWYRGLRDLVVTGAEAAGLPARPRILDAGCGTGATLGALGEALSPSYLGGFDLSETALICARRKAPTAKLFRADLRDPQLPGGTDDLDLVLCLDVIYIPGVEASLAGLWRLVDALRPGGLFIVNLPAYDWLFSEHDVAVHTRERYTKGRVGRLFDSLGLDVEFLTYRLWSLFPLVVARRLPRLTGAGRGLPGRGPGAARSALHSVPGPLLNTALEAAVVAENRLITRGVTFPYGSSVFAIGRRR